MIRMLMQPWRMLVDFVVAVGEGARFFLRLCLLGLAAFRRPRLVIDQIHFIGNYSLSIILVSGLLVGFVLGLQGYYTLRSFGSAKRSANWSRWRWCANSARWLRRCCLPVVPAPRSPPKSA